jgi:hypothetical protein
MIVLDPYLITLFVAERIRDLFEAGDLADVEPDREYGYTCRAVFGMHTDDIAAIREEEGAGDRRMLWFYLTDGRVIPDTPDASAFGSRTGRVTIH